MGLFDLNNNRESIKTSIVPTGILKKLKTSEIKKSDENPRQLFDPEPLNDLKESIRAHGVLVPITVYEVKGQPGTFGILDGERRFRCCVDIEKESNGKSEILIPANIVEPPDKIAGLLYMFSIHNYREAWELMPTALSLKLVMEELGETDNKKLAHLTGLSDTQVERCKWLLDYPERFQKMSLDPDPKTRIPSNFWIEAHPVLELYEKNLPTLLSKLGKEVIIERLVEKYRKKAIQSVIHFRRIREAYARAKDKSPQEVEKVKKRLEEYIENIKMETRDAFDDFLPKREIKTAISACDDFTQKLEGLKLEYDIENRETLTKALRKVQDYVESLLHKLEGEDAPTDVKSNVAK